ncbi:MAG: pre-peptidase C-terminal domain-containing protein, partial [Thermoanaerobaculia bacterium]|nr:pre-peptidase C-terminal domain-containing protein [Thermoanaerobaculia bacterium]
MGSCLRRPLVATLFVCLLLVPLALPAAAAEGLRIEEVKASEAMKFPLPGEKVPEPRGLPEYAPEGMAFFLETEPNDTAATANALAGSGAVVYGTITAGDNDYFAFTANAGDRVSAAVMTQFSNVSGDSRLDIIGTDGTTSLEFDDDSGSFSGLSSAISGTLLPAAGTYYVRVYGYSATTVITPYHLHVKVASGSATAEVEPNNDLATATPLPASGWVSGTITATTDPDFFSFSLNAGDSVFLALDMDPDRAAANTN